ESVPMNRKQRRAAAKLGSPATQLLATAVRFHRAGQLVAAEACYRQVLAAQPNLAEGHFRLGDALRGQGKFDEGVAAYRCAIGFKSNYAEAHSNLGNALINRKLKISWLTKLKGYIKMYLHYTRRRPYWDKSVEPDARISRIRLSDWLHRFE